MILPESSRRLKIRRGGSEEMGTLKSLSARQQTEAHSKSNESAHISTALFLCELEHALKYSHLSYYPELASLIAIEAYGLYLYLLRGW